MSETSGVRLAVFTKPWPRKPLAELAEFVAGMGYQGVELPTREGYQVPPDRVADELPAAARTLARHGVAVPIVTGPPLHWEMSDGVLAACQEAGVEVIKTLVQIGPDGYLPSVSRAQKEFDALGPRLEKFGLMVGVQNHCDGFVPNALGLHHLLAPLDPRRFGAIWDPAHCALDGERPTTALDVLGDRLCAVYFKNAVYIQTNGPEADWAQWRVHWTGGRHGLAPWPAVAKLLQERGYRGWVCQHPEYTDESVTDRQAREDAAFLRSLFEGAVNE